MSARLKSPAKKVPEILHAYRVALPPGSDPTNPMIKPILYRAMIRAEAEAGLYRVVEKSPGFTFNSRLTTNEISFTQAEAKRRFLVEKEREIEFHRTRLDKATSDLHYVKFREPQHDWEPDARDPEKGRR
jgi:hypothetical protein